MQISLSSRLPTTWRGTHRGSTCSPPPLSQSAMMDEAVHQWVGMLMRVILYIPILLTPSGAVHAVTRVHLISVNRPITAVDYTN